MTLAGLFETLGSIPAYAGAIFGLGLCIFIHELGHFLAARGRGLHVTRFSIGMGPKLFSWVKNGVEYRLSILPIGGYVALPQLADMGRIEGAKEGETETTQEELPPISFVDKFLVAVMGAVFNFLFAMVLALLLWWLGQPTSSSNLTTNIGYVNETLMIEGKAIPGPAAEAGILPGDKVIKIDGQRINSFIDIRQKILTGVGRTDDGRPEAQLEIMRGDEILELTVYPAIDYFNPVSKDPVRDIGVEPENKVKIGSVTPNSPAMLAGLQPGDVVVRTNGKPIHHLYEFIKIIADQPNSPAHMEIQRGDEIINMDLVPKVIARTKPLVVIDLERQTMSSSFSVRPDFPDSSEALKTDLASNASLHIHRIISNEGNNLSKLRQEDRIIAINSKAITSLASLQETIAQVQGPVIHITVGRADNTQTIPIQFTSATTEATPPQTQPLVGFIASRETVITHVDPFKQFAQQIDTTIQVLKALLNRNSDISIGHLSGPIGIVRQLGEATRVDFRYAIQFLILINVNLGILNLLPIPILDGGHILFGIISKLRLKSLPIRFVASLQGTFMMLLFSLMIYVIIKDSIRWKGDAQSINENQQFSKLIIDPVFVEANESKTE